MKLKQLIHFLTAGILMAFAWSLRGQFGHLKGALLPGAAAAVILAMCMEEEHWRERFGKAVVLSAVGFGIGGHIGYGSFFDSIIQFPGLREEYFHIACIGVIWGAMGGTMLGFGFSEKPVSRFDWFVLSSIGVFWFLTLQVWELEKWDLLLFLCGLVAVHFYNIVFKKSEIIGAFAVAGGFAWGTAFFISASILALGRQGFLGDSWPWWNLRDQILGFMAGTCFWMIAGAFQRFRFRRNLAEDVLLSQRVGFLCYTAVIPAFYAVNACFHWLSVKDSTMVLPFAVLMALAFVATLVTGVCLRNELFLRPRFSKLLAVSTLLVFGYCSVLAVGKQMWVLGFDSWEAAYGFFVFFWLTLAGLLVLCVRDLNRFPDV